MGAKQSKRSVDISGKDAECAGEVAVAGAVVEGRVEQLADADALKPQLNGDAHIHEQTDKEKQLDSGTPENEKDATTEKEGKEKDNETEKETEKEAAPVTNGDTDVKGENGESTPTPEEGKKPKKEKVKKKWSLRSISFSRKDKPKQEKKHKEEEPKTNGEHDKVPEEAAEAAAEIAAPEVAEEAKSETETKDEKTPETPVTEPLTNGSSSPESPKVETPAAEEPSPAPVESERQEPKTQITPEQLPVNGLSLEEVKPEAPEVTPNEENKEQPTAEPSETVPAPEIPVKQEVCVEQMPLESTPPPLPANPPPSSVASFAATTMAPELTDASLANTAELVISAPHIATDTKVELAEPAHAPQIELTTDTELINNSESLPRNDIVVTELPSPLKETSDDKPAELSAEVVVGEFPPPLEESGHEGESEEVNAAEKIEQPAIDKTEAIEPVAAVVNILIPESNVDTYETKQNERTEMREAIDDQVKDDKALAAPTELDINLENIPEPVADITDSIEELPPPPSMEELVQKDIVEPIVDLIEDIKIASAETVNSIIENINGMNPADLNGHDKTQQENLKNKTKDSLIGAIECNGIGEVLKTEVVSENGVVVTPEDSAPPSLSESNEAAAEGSADASEAFPPPPSELDATPPPASPVAPATPQELAPVSDKLADLIPEVPVVPELKSETLTETTTDAVAAN